MSVRELKLCDLPKWRDELCQNPAVDTCVLCERDMCSEHVMHPKRGLVLKIESWRQDTNPPRDTAWGAQAGQAMPQEGWTFPSVRIAVCRECRVALDPDYAHGNRSVLEDAVDSLTEALIKKLRAALTAKKMTAKSP